MRTSSRITETLLSLLVVMSLSLASLAFVTGQVFAEESAQMLSQSKDTPANTLELLQMQSLKLSDMGKNAMLLDQGGKALEDYSHPLNSHAMLQPQEGQDATNADQSNFSYLAAYGFSGLLIENGVAVGNYLYQYSDSKQAKQSAKIFVDNILKNQATAKLLDEFGSEDETQYSQAISFTGDEGDYMDWFVMNRNETLILLNANGFDAAQLKQAFYSSVAKILGKSSNNPPLFKLYMPLLESYRNSTISPSSVNATQWQIAYAVNQIFLDPSGIWHYGARFSGSNGSRQYFTGRSGQPSNYSSYTWHPSQGSRSILLLEKRWLFIVVCADMFGTPSICNDRWNGSNHHALMTCPC